MKNIIFHHYLEFQDSMYIKKIIFMVDLVCLSIQRFKMRQLIGFYLQKPDNSNKIMLFQALNLII